jgi:protein-S-isoprenylcysteine O-methyltransferase Ste14
MAHYLTPLSRLRASEGYERVVRDLGCVWFLLLAAVVIQGIYEHLETIRLGEVAIKDVADLISRLCITSVYASLAWLILHRPPAMARTQGILPAITALVGTYLPWSFMLVAADRDPTGLNPLSSVCMVGGTVGAVVAIFYLGKSFSIVPQARRLVREGPYLVVRHPLYLAEELALLGCLLRFFSSVTLALFAAHCALQVARIIFEERLMRGAFPEYEDYVRSTSRLIPYVW